MLSALQLWEFSNGQYWRQCNTTAVLADPCACSMVRCSAGPGGKQIRQIDVHGEDTVGRTAFRLAVGEPVTLLALPHRLCCNACQRKRGVQQDFFRCPFAVVLALPFTVVLLLALQGVLGPIVWLLGGELAGLQELVAGASLLINCTRGPERNSSTEAREWKCEEQ